MMDKTRRRIAAAACAAACLLGGCAPAQEQGPAPVTFTFFNMDGVSDSWTDPVAQEITRITGVSLRTEYPSRGSTNAIDLMLAGGDYPDLIFAKEDANKLIEAGVLINLAPYIEQYGPNIKKLYGERYQYLRHSADDPAIYQLSCAGADEEIYTTSGTAQLQWAVLKENDYEIPYTLAQYEAQIKAYMAEHPTINGEATIGISVCCTDWHWYITLFNPASMIAAGSPDNGQWLIDEETGTAVYAHTSEEHRAFFRWLNRMYHEGVLDPEFATQTHDDYLQKIASGRVLGLLDAEWDYADSEKTLLERDEEERTYAGLPVTMDESIVCASLQNQGGLTPGYGVGITTACEDPVRAVQFLDWLCSDEGQVLLNWGIEGVNYFVGEDGRRWRTDEEIRRAREDIDYPAQTGVRFHAYPFPCYGYGVLDSTGSPYRTEDKASTIAVYNSEEQAACEAWGVEMLRDIFPSSDSFPEATHAPAWTIPISSELSGLKKELDDIAWPRLIDCILCPQEDFDAAWESLQQALREAGSGRAGQMMTQVIREQSAFWQSLADKTE